MTAGDLLDGLVEETLDNPARAVSSLLQQLIGPALGDDLAEALAGRVVGALTDVLTPAEPASRLVDAVAEDAAYAALVERNTVLAAALGACDCWGEFADCQTCGGAGAAGWLHRDQAAFDLYITPALQAFEQPARPGEPDPTEKPPATTRIDTTGQTAKGTGP